MNSRRGFIKSILGSIAFLSAWLSPATLWIRSALAQTKRLVLPKSADPENLYSKDPDTLDTSNLAVTPIENFKTMGKTTYPVTLQTWRFNVLGQVEEPLHLTYDQVLGLPSFEKNVLLICPGVFSYNGHWRGVVMKPLLDLAGADENATHIVFSGYNDSFTKEETFPIQEIKNNKVFLAYAVNGKKLPEKHGFPLRVVAEDYYGDDWIKYVYEMKIIGAPTK